MDLEIAEQIARREIEYHLGEKWYFGWDRAVKRLGQCDYGLRKITISRVWTSLNSEAMFMDTLMHEIAHGLAGWGAGHGSEWQRQAALLGADPYARAMHAEAYPQGRYQGHCAKGAEHGTFHRHRRVRSMIERRIYCSECGVTEEGRIVWVDMQDGGVRVG